MKHARTITPDAPVAQDSLTPPAPTAPGAVAELGWQRAEHVFRRGLASLGVRALGAHGVEANRPKPGALAVRVLRPDLLWPVRKTARPAQLLEQRR